ncbi:MAG: hypothetical protein H6686_11330 [Fibrobacteria bacterium]|nr:hypothetical protein [Fibrobacteria bacterium]
MRSQISMAFLILAPLLVLHGGAFWMGLRRSVWIPWIIACLGLGSAGGTVVSLFYEETHPGFLAGWSGMDFPMLSSLLLYGFVGGLLLVSLAGLFWMGRAWTARKRGILRALVLAVFGLFHVALTVGAGVFALGVLAGFMGDPGPRYFEEPADEITSGPPFGKVPGPTPWTYL